MLPGASSFHLQIGPPRYIQFAFKSYPIFHAVEFQTRATQLYTHAKMAPNYMAHINEDYYKVFGLAQSATGTVIRARYVELSKTIHPDKSSDPNATQKFQLLNDACSTLFDLQKRALNTRESAPTMRENHQRKNLVPKLAVPKGDNRGRRKLDELPLEGQKLDRRKPDRGQQKPIRGRKQDKRRPDRRPK